MSYIIDGRRECSWWSANQLDQPQWGNVSSKIHQKFGFCSSLLFIFFFIMTTVYWGYDGKLMFLFYLIPWQDMHLCVSGWDVVCIWNLKRFTLINWFIFRTKFTRSTKGVFVTFISLENLHWKMAPTTEFHIYWNTCIPAGLNWIKAGFVLIALYLESSLSYQQKLFLCSIFLCFCAVHCWLVVAIGRSHIHWTPFSLDWTQNKVGFRWPGVFLESRLPYQL